MTYAKRNDLTPDTRAIADLGDGLEARVARVVETTIDGPRIELDTGEVVQARRITKPAMQGMVVELDTGHLVLIEYVTKPQPESLAVSVHVLATWVDADLNPMTGSGGKPVKVEMKHSAAQAQQDELGLSGVLRECLRLVLGEPLEVVAPPPAGPDNPEPQPGGITLIPWTMEMVLASDIRRAINIATQAAAIDLDALL